MWLAIAELRIVALRRARGAPRRIVSLAIAGRGRSGDAVPAYRSIMAAYIRRRRPVHTGAEGGGASGYTARDASTARKRRRTPETIDL